MSEQLESFLSSVPLFQGLEPDLLATLAGKVDRLKLRGGQVLFHAGEAADCMYLVLNGRLRAILEVDGRVRTLGEIGRGDCLGEMALITGERRSATVRAVRDSDLLRLSQAAFAGLVESSPRVLLAMTRRIVGQYQTMLTTTRADRRGTISTLAVVPLGSGVDAQDLAARLAEQWGSRTALVSSRSIDAQLGPGMSQTPFDHSRNAELLSHLNVLEPAHDLVVYVGDPEPSTWTTRCARQADRVLLVTGPDADPRPGAIERRLTADGVDQAPVELVIVHPESLPLYPQTGRWLAERRVERHHHLTVGSATDLARVVRLLSGRATGLVLGGGGARSFAQIGILKALEECGCPIDLVGGTSMGAFIGAQLASGWDARRIQEFNRECWAEERPLRDYTFPYLSLVGGLRVLRVFKELYGDSDIEDLPLGFYCCTSNLTRATVRVCRRGSIYRWLAASIAVPGIAPPVPYEGDLYVDGAVLDNLPTDVMAEASPGRVVAVDVSPVEELAVDRDLREPPSGWSLARKRLNPWAGPARMPTIFELLSRVTALASIRQLEEMKRLADLYLHPPTEGFSILDWGAIDELTELGYRYSKPLIEKWMAGDAKAPPVAGG